VTFVPWDEQVITETVTGRSAVRRWCVTPADRVDRTGSFLVTLWYTRTCERPISFRETKKTSYNTLSLDCQIQRQLREVGLDCQIPAEHTVIL
jgi:hypothetical protein